MPTEKSLACMSQSTKAMAHYSNPLWKDIKRAREAFLHFWLFASCTKSDRISENSNDKCTDCTGVKWNFYDSINIYVDTYTVIWIVIQLVHVIACVQPTITYSLCTNSWKVLFVFFFSYCRLFCCLSIVNHFLFFTNLTVTCQCVQYSLTQSEILIHPFTVVWNDTLR
jgi:hypothetical protein